VPKKVKTKSAYLFGLLVGLLLTQVVKENFGFSDLSILYFSLIVTFVKTTNEKSETLIMMMLIK
jgi:hypothetical protein